MLDQHDDIQAISGLGLSEMFRRIVEHYVVGADFNVINHVPGLSDGFIQFLTDSLPYTISNFTLNQKMDGMLRVEVTVGAHRVAQIVVKSASGGSLFFDIGP